MRKSEKDVRLTHGTGYIVEETAYQHHLSSGSEIQEVCFSIRQVHFQLTFCQKSKCTNHRALHQANAHLNNLEATGIGACACSRHGCFIPHSVVDFQKGER